MNSYDFWWAVGRGTQNSLGWFYDNVQDYFNNFVIILGFVAAAYWLVTMKKLRKKAEEAGTLE